MTDEHSVTLAELATDLQLSISSREAILAAIDELDRLGELLTFVRDTSRFRVDEDGKRLAEIYDRIVDFDAP